MKVTRQITWFNPHNERLVGEYTIDNISLDALKQVFPYKKDDPLMYDPYNIYSEEADKLSEYIDFKFDFTNFIYQIECFQA